LDSDLSENVIEREQIVIEKREQILEKYKQVKSILKDIAKTIIIFILLALTSYVLYKLFEFYFVVDLVLALPPAFVFMSKFLRVRTFWIFRFNIRANELEAYQVPKTFKIRHKNAKIVITDQNANNIYIAKELYINRILQKVEIESFFDKQLSAIEFYTNASAFENVSSRYQKLLEDTTKFIKLYEVMSMERGKNELIDLIKRLRRVRKNEEEI